MKDIVFIMGKSSSGKDHIYQALKADKELKLNGVVLYTTRPKRVSETDGVEYHFVTEDDVVIMEAQEKIIEMRVYNTVFGEWKYFTADDGQIVLDGHSKYVVIGTLKAYIDFVKYFGKEHIMPIYIEVEDGIRLMRAIEREKKQENPAYDELCRRFLADAEDFAEDKLEAAGIRQRFDNNGAIEDCINAIKMECRACWERGYI